MHRIGMSDMKPPTDQVCECSWPCEAVLWNVFVGLCTHDAPCLCLSVAKLHVRMSQFGQY